MGYIKSKFSYDTKFWGIFTIIPLIILLIFTHRVIKNYIFNLSDTLILILFILLLYLVINFLKHIKHIVIIDNTLKYYSILRPFGKTLHFGDYTGKIILKEMGAGGSYNVIYLINRQNQTSFKIMGLHYKNFEEINMAIPLKTIRFAPVGLQYFKLLFIGKINIGNNIDKKGNTENILKIIKILCVSGLILFVIGVIVRIVLRA